MNWATLTNLCVNLLRRLRAQQTDDGAKLQRIVARVLFANMVLTMIPQAGVERRPVFCVERRIN